LMVQSAMDAMATSNAVAAKLASAYGLFPMTDVTGFGLMRHARSLADRYDPQMGLSISLGQIPCFDGVDQLIRAGIASSMVSDNAFATRLINAASTPLPHALIHDPQTSGGLLMFVTASQAKELCQQLIKTGHHAALIGHINDANDGAITVTD
jgi:selenide,water dikinase